MRRGATEIIFTDYVLRLMFSLLKSNAVRPSCNLRNLWLFILDPSELPQHHLVRPQGSCKSSS